MFGDDLLRMAAAGSWERVAMPLPGDEDWQYSIKPWQEGRPLRYGDVIEDGEGKPAYRKEVFNPEAADREVFGSLVHRAVGANAARVVHDPEGNPNRVMVQMEENLFPLSYSDEAFGRPRYPSSSYTPKGVLSGLGDLLTRETDSRYNNARDLPNGEPYRYDFEGSRPSPHRTGEVTINRLDQPIHWSAGVESDFAHRFYDADAEHQFRQLKSNPLHPVHDVPRITAALQALRPDYETHDRLDWHDELMRRWNEVAQHASGDRPVLEGITLPHEQAAQQRVASASVWYHGTPDERTWQTGGAYGLHVGTEEAARQALNARIGRPLEGDWDGTREYGKTLLSPYQRTGTHRDLEEAQFPTPGAATYSNGEPVPMDARPSIFPVRIVGPMVNTEYSPLHDDYANSRMHGQITRGNARRGYYYTNIGEDEGSVSAAVPSAAHLERVDRQQHESAVKAKKKPAKPRKPEEVWYDVHKHPTGVPGGMGKSPEHHLRNRGWQPHEIHGASNSTIQYMNHDKPDFVISFGGASSTKPDHNFRVLYIGTNRNIPKVTRCYSVAEAMNKVDELHTMNAGHIVLPMTHGAAAPPPTVLNPPADHDARQFMAPHQPKKPTNKVTAPTYPLGKPKSQQSPIKHTLETPEGEENEDLHQIPQTPGPKQKDQFKWTSSVADSWEEVGEHLDPVFEEVADDPRSYV